MKWMFFLLTLDRVFETMHNVSASQLEVLVLGVSCEGKHHVTKSSGWEAETSWIVSKNMIQTE